VNGTISVGAPENRTGNGSYGWSTKGAAALTTIRERGTHRRWLFTPYTACQRLSELPKAATLRLRHPSDAEIERLFRASPTELMRQPQDTGQLDIGSVTGRLRWILVEIKPRSAPP